LNKESRLEVKLFYIVLIPFMLMGSVVGSPVSWRDIVYPQDRLMQSISEMPDIVKDQVIFEAAYELADMGALDVLICGISRIEAPVGGWLLEGLAELEIEEVAYSTFIIGIEDSGEVFAFIARGLDADDLTCWFPTIGPDHTPAEGEPFPDELLEFEFLLDREGFETLIDVFPRPEIAGNSNQG